MSVIKDILEERDVVPFDNPQYLVTSVADVLCSLEIKRQAKEKAKELFTEVRRLGGLGLHAEAPEIQEQATLFWMQSLGRDAPA